MKRDMFRILLLLSLILTAQSNYITAGKWQDEFTLSSGDEKTPKLVKHSLSLPAGSEVSCCVAFRYTNRNVTLVNANILYPAKVFGQIGTYDTSGS